jgi:dienelactone hydrolase
MTAEPQFRTVKRPTHPRRGGWADRWGWRAPVRVGMGLALTVAAVITGCSDSASGPGTPIEEPELDAIFAPATAAEIAQVEGEWASRDPSADGVQILNELPFLLGPETGTVKIVSHVVDGFTHYGAVITPPDADPGSLPVLVYAHGGDQGVSLTEIQLLATVLGPEATQMVFVVPSFRSERITFGNLSYLSGGTPSPWDRDVDDALALLDVALGMTPEADPTRVGAVGFSRGAGVALLMAVRKPDIDVVVDFFGPTDFMSDWVRGIVRDALRGGTADLPGFSPLNQQFIQPYDRGEISVSQFRLELIRRSAVLWADRLPDVQIHHGQQDDVVPVSQAQALIDALLANGRTAPTFEYYIYPDGRHDPFTLDGAVARTEVFLGRSLDFPVTVAAGVAADGSGLPEPAGFTWSWARRAPIH